MKNELKFLLNEQLMRDSVEVFSIFLKQDQWKIGNYSGKSEALQL